MSKPRPSRPDNSNANPLRHGPSYRREERYWEAAGRANLDEVRIPPATKRIVHHGGTEARRRALASSDFRDEDVVSLTISKELDATQCFPCLRGKNLCSPEK